MSLGTLAAAKSISFGTAMATWGDKPEVYFKITAAQFKNITTFTHFALQNPEKDKFVWVQSDLQLKFAEEHNLKLYAPGLLFWWSDPEWCRSLPTKTEIRKALVMYLTQFFTRYKGKMTWATVVNENLGLSLTDSRNNQIPWRKLGTDNLEYVRIAHRVIHRVDSAVKLLYNDNGIEFATTKSLRVFNILKGLKAENIPIHGIGFQCHFKIDMVNKLPVLLPRFISTIKKFRDIGLQPYITELDVAIPKTATGIPTEQQLADQRAIYRAIVDTGDQAGCKMMTVWSFTDAYSWLDTAYPTLGYACIYDASYRKKPAYYGVEKALST